MIHHYIDTVVEDGIRYVESSIELHIFHKGFVLSKRRWAVGKAVTDEDTPKRSLHMEVSVWMDMTDTETQSDAEDRLIEQAECAGLKVTGWNTDESEVVTWEDDGK